MGSVLRRLLFFFQRNQFDRDLEDELRFHEEMKAHALADAEGMSGDEARAAARGTDAQRGEEIRTLLERGELLRLAASGELRVDRVVGSKMIERDAPPQGLVCQGRPGRERLDALLRPLR